MALTDGEFSTRSIQQMLELVIEHLDMEVAFVGEFVDARRVFRYVSASSATDIALPVGQSDPLEASFCHHIATGRMHAVIADAARDPQAQQLAATAALGVRAHIGTPIVLKDGTVYGTLCSFRRQADPSLDQRDLRFLRFVARLLAERLHEQRLTGAVRERQRAQIDGALALGDPTMVFQPIVHLPSAAVAGFEALARFRAAPQQPPERWFADARELGRHTDLELRAMRAALAQMPGLGDAYLSINLSPTVLATREVPALLDGVDRSRIVLELTELDNSAEPVGLRRAIDDLRAGGVRVALDDVGAGYSGLSRLLAIAPDIVKLDRDITRGIATDVVRQSMVTATVTFCAAVGATLVAEGIESADDLRALEKLGIDHGQGFLLGLPAAAPYTVAPPHAGGQPS